jgi:phosphoribosylformylglycinamidine (FGAM) synthase-like amidotransferase family enzyme
MLPLPLPDGQGRFVMLMRNSVYPSDVKIADVVKVNMMTADILLEENDRLVICGSVSAMDHEKNTLAHMVQMTPSVAKKMSTLFQVTFAEPPLAINCTKDCYISKGTTTCEEI